MNILRNWPFLELASTVQVGDETVAIRPYQIVIWVSVSLQDVLPKNAPRFPAILDTGHNHNFSIREGQMSQWAGIQIDACPKIGAILVNHVEVPLLSAHDWVHRNRPGSSDLLPKPVHLSIPEGISVYPVHSSSAPRLPLLGLRGIVRNGWRMVIDGTEISLARKRPKSGIAQQSNDA